jgi:hypothetical protein
MHSSIPTVAVLTALVVLAGCVAPLQAGAAESSPTADPDEGTAIRTTGVGEVTAEPDLAVVAVAVQARADGADAARDRVAADVDGLLTALTDAGVPEDAVRTVYFSIQTEYDYRGESREPVGFRAVHALRVEVAPDRAGEVVDLAVDAGGATVDGVSFTLTDDRRASLRGEALADAVARARADADAVARAAGLSVTGVADLQVGSEGGYRPVVAERVGGADGADAATSFRPGPVTVTASVSVVYTAE